MGWALVTPWFAVTDLRTPCRSTACVLTGQSQRVCQRRAVSNRLAVRPHLVRVGDENLPHGHTLDATVGVHERCCRVELG
jgi:hypothetical protein